MWLYVSGCVCVCSMGQCGWARVSACERMWVRVCMCVCLCVSACVCAVCLCGSTCVLADFLWQKLCEYKRTMCQCVCTCVEHQRWHWYSLLAESVGAQSAFVIKIRKTSRKYVCSPLHGCTEPSLSPPPPLLSLTCILGHFPPPPLGGGRRRA